ncbi:MAG: FxLYD domain-containing protein [Peptoanaerobacter stomatis]|uniref:FxLYD domain-containing protein n=1 Tax=Peptoanaerobacter stomatis TaxID=796937 RepID=UPI003FA101A6
MSLKKCNTCGADIATSAKTCPSCGASNKKSIFKKSWFWIIIIIIISSYDFQIAENDTSKTSTTSGKYTETVAENKETVVEEIENPNLIDGKFELLNGETTLLNDGYFTYIVGSLRNTTDKTYSYAQITFNIYDADGAQIDTAMDNINNWEAGGIWKFKAMLLDNGNVVSYKLMNISAF